MMHVLLLAMRTETPAICSSDLPQFRVSLALAGLMKH